MVAGANGSGKTTFATQLIIETGYEFLNANEIEKAITEPNESAKLKAERLFFQRLSELMVAGQSFILESTLSGKYLLDVIEKAQIAGYVFKLFYVYLESPDVCIERIKNRVRLGGHFVPDEDVRRRYYRSKQNFWHTYKNLAEDWSLFNNPLSADNQLVAVGSRANYQIESIALFQQFITDLSNGSKAI